MKTVNTKTRIKTGLAILFAFSANALATSQINRVEQQAYSELSPLLTQLIEHKVNQISLQIEAELTTTIEK